MKHCEKSVQETSSHVVKKADFYVKLLSSSRQGKRVNEDNSPLPARSEAEGGGWCHKNPRK